MGVVTDKEEIEMEKKRKSLSTNIKLMERKVITCIYCKQNSL